MNVSPRATIDQDLLDMLDLLLAPQGSDSAHMRQTKKDIRKKLCEMGMKKYCDDIIVA